MDVTNAPARLGSLIDTIQQGCPDVTIIVAQIIHTGYDNVNVNVTTYNNQIASDMQARIQQGQKIAVVNMQNILASDDYADDLHPNDQGYAIMGQAWANAINQAASLITPPLPEKSQVCNSLPTWMSNGEIATGAGLGESLYAPITCTAQ